MSIINRIIIFIISIFIFSTTFVSAVKAHTDLSFGSIDKLNKVIAHAKKKFGLKKVEIQKLDKKYL